MPRKCKFFPKRGIDLHIEDNRSEILVDFVLGCANISSPPLGRLALSPED